MQIVQGSHTDTEQSNSPQKVPNLASNLPHRESIAFHSSGTKLPEEDDVSKSFGCLFEVAVVLS